jgi:hypothetical protein
MKKQLLIALFLCSTVFIACAAGKKTAKKKTTTKATTSTANSGAITSVMMRRGACFGRCPEYTLTVNSNGVLEYNGTRNANPLGVYQKNIGTSNAQAMIKQFVDHRVDTCVTAYTSNVADLPGLSYTIMRGSKSQLIGNANFGPRFLVELSEDMDEIGKVDATWKRVSGPKVD